MAKTTTPLTKLFRTTEGWLVLGFNAAIGAAAVFGSLPGTQALKWGAVVTGITMTARTGLKAIALLSPLTGDPIEPPNAEKVLQEIEAAAAAVEAFQAKPGTPAIEIVAAGAPDEEPPGATP